MILSDFKVALPQHRVSQETNLNWLRHAYFEAAKHHPTPDNRPPVTLERVSQMVTRFGCQAHQVRQRWSDLTDFLHQDWSQMTLFNIQRRPEGAPVSERMTWYFNRMVPVFEQLYEENVTPPEDLIHVTCTGYHSPSPAQKFVHQSGWHRSTTITHAYHMGCFGAFPAVKMAAGYLSAKPDTPHHRVDIVHTETCTLHLNPIALTPEQIVVQSLFSDGYIKYSVCHETSSKPGLRLVAQLEEMIPDTDKMMQWGIGPSQFQMTLAKTVPDHIQSTIYDFVKRLASQCDLTADQLCQHALFAIHPGGPRIIEQVAETLGLKPNQTKWSREILLDRGNMSSATLPHVWDKMVGDPTIKSGDLVTSIAFGPGLTITGFIFEKV